MSGHKEINEQLRRSFGLRVGNPEPDEGSKKMNAWIRHERAASLLFDPNQGEAGEPGDRGEG